MQNNIAKLQAPSLSLWVVVCVASSRRSYPIKQGIHRQTERKRHHSGCPSASMINFRSSWTKGWVDGKCGCEAVGLSMVGRRRRRRKKKKGGGEEGYIESCLRCQKKRRVVEERRFHLFFLSSAQGPENERRKEGGGGGGRRRWSSHTRAIWPGMGGW